MADLDSRFQIRLVHFIKKKNILYSDKHTSLMQNQSLKSEV